LAWALQKPIFASETSSGILPFNKKLEKLKQTERRYELFTTKEMQAVAKIEASLLKGAREYFDDNGFVEIVVPHLTRATGACENVFTMFTVDHFNEKAYLAQTGQLYLEVLTPFLEKVWCVGPSFRAEPSVDKRHLTEFTLIELEFQGTLRELLEHIEGVVHSMIQEVIAKRREELELLEIDRKRLNAQPPFKKITYTDAVRELEEFNVKWGDDLKSWHEKFLTEKHGNKPLFITHYPKAIKFFNMKTNEENPDIVNSADLLLPYSGEAVGAAEREYEYEELYKRLESSTMLKQLIERGGSIKDFEWYLEFYRKFGGIPHAGCGIGLNRVTQYVLGSKDIRTTTVFPLNKESIL
jgi:asparaginyl-tRNA synthetase